MASDQQSLHLAFGVHRSPRDAPARIVRQIDSDAQALAVAMKSGGHKLANVAKAIGKSEGYVSRLRKGKRPIPDRLVPALCAATGSNLLAQFRSLQAALAECEVTRLSALLSEAA